MAVVNSFIQDDVSLLYVAYFGRAADASGFSHWCQDLAADPSTSTQSGAATASYSVAANFALSPEFQATYGGLTPTEQVTKLYENVLNRVPDADGLAYWVNEINSGTAFSTVAWQVVYAASLGGEGIDPNDTALVNNKKDVGLYFAKQLVSDNVEIAYTAFDTITEDPNTVPPTCVELTVATANQITLTPVEQTYRGSAGDNTFNGLGYLNASGVVVPTLQNGDTLIGSVNGFNTLNANIFGTNVTPAGLRNIDFVTLTNTAASTISLANAESVSAIALNSLAGNMTVNEIQLATTDYAINNTTGGNKLVTLNVADTAVAGLADVAQLVVTNSNVKLVLDAGYEAAEVLSTAGYGLMNTIATDFAGDLALAGAGNLTLTSNSSVFGSSDVDSTLLTGTLSITNLAEADFTFVGGNGNTSINASGVGTTATNNLSMDYGNGINSLTVNSLLTVSNAVTIQGGSGVDSLILGAATIENSDLAFAPMSGFDTLILNASGTNSVTIGTEFEAAGFATILGSSTNDSIIADNIAIDTLLYRGGAGSDSFLFNTASGTINISEVELVTTSTGGSLAQTVNIFDGTGSVSVALGGGSDTVNIEANNTVTVTTTGVETINALLASTTGNTVILGDNATAVTITGGLGKLTVNAEAVSTAANTYTFGVAADTLQISNLNNMTSAVSIDGGLGVDTLQLMAGSNANTDGAFAKFNAFDTLQLSSAGTNNITVGTNFVNVADFTTITGGTNFDTVTAQAVALNGLTFNGGNGTGDSFVFNTASGSVTVNQVEAVDATAGGVNNQTVTIANGTGTVTVSLGAGTGDTVNFEANNTVTVTTTGVETINALLASTTGNTVILGDNATAVTITGGLGKLTVNAEAVSTAANTYTFGVAADTLQISNLNNMTSAVSIDGGLGVDTLQLMAGSNANTDGAFAKFNAFDTLSLVNTATNNVTIGTNFLAADFTTITGGTNFDTVTAQSVTLSGLTFNGGTGTGDTLVLNTAGGTVTINSVETVTSTGNAGTTLTIAGAATLTAGIDLGLGTDSVINTNTNAVTVTLTGAETYFGSVGADALTLGSNGAISITGGGGTDTVTLAVNTSNVTVLGTGGMMSVIGSAATAAPSETLTIAGSGTYNLTSIETVSVTGGVDATINATLFSIGSTASTGEVAVTTLFNYDLGTGNALTANFVMTQAGATGGASYLTVDAGDATNATISLTNSLAATGGTGASLVITNDAGYTTIAMGTGADIVQTNLAGLSDGTSTADSFVVSSFTTADSVDLTDYTLTDKAGRTTILQTSYFTSAGVQDADVFTLNTTFITGNSTTLANLTSTDNQRGIIFQFNMGSTTADFTTQAGINTAVSWIDANIGTTTSGSQSAVFAVNSGSGTSSALFLFQDNGTVGVDASELQLIGVVSGSALSASSFS